jgi:hypothetical protein
MNALESSVKDKYPEHEVVTQKDLLDSINDMMANTRTFLGGH